MQMEVRQLLHRILNRIGSISNITTHTSHRIGARGHE
jgi:hypothetical protein